MFLLISLAALLVFGFTPLALAWLLVHDLLSCYEAENALPAGLTSDDARVAAEASLEHMLGPWVAFGRAYAAHAGAAIVRR